MLIVEVPSILLQVVLLEDIEGVEADKLVKKCPVGVFDIEDIGQSKMFSLLKSSIYTLTLKFLIFYCYG